MTKRLVVISYHHPPDPAIGGMRWAALTKYLAPHGWKSWIVTGAAASTPATGNGNGPVVVSCPRRTTLNDLYRRFRLRNGTAVRQWEWDSNGNGRGRGRGLLTRVRLEAGMLLSLPDDARGWVLRAAARARRLIAELQPDAVVSSGPPHSAHLAAWLATRGSKTRWLADLRDPWAGPVTGAWRASPSKQSLLAQFLTERLERLVAHSASGMLCNTQEFAAALSERYPDVPVTWVPNAVDRELLPSAAAEPLPGFGLAYVGTVYGGRNLRPVLRALRAFLDLHPGTEGCTLRIAGPIEGKQNAALRRDIEELALHDHVELLGVLSRAAALQLVARSRLGIVLAQDQELQVPAKLYELVGMGVPTVVIASERSAAASEAKRVGAIAIDPADTTSLVQVMESLTNGGARPRTNGAAVDYRDVVGRVASLLAPV
jgi:glycosyltransferase involved in cell wall biosynthesis